MFPLISRPWLKAFCTAASLLAGACDDPAPAEKPKEILAYIGITMAKPMAEIAAIVEERTGAKVIITQGGSEDLYQSLKTSRQGDLYMPGSASYRERHVEEGLLGEFVHVGFNQAAFLVAKGNPKAVSADPAQVLRSDLSIVVCNPESGSIGRETKRILSEANVFDRAFERAQYLTTDSRNLNKALRNGEADLIINWRATAFFSENRPAMDIVDFAPEVAQPKKLLLNLLPFSRNKDIAREVMAVAASSEGQAIFRKYGFLDAKGIGTR